MAAERDSPATSNSDPLIGALLADRYRVLRKLGEGGMGRVYEAEHVAIRRKVAVKCLHASYASDAVAVERFHREAIAATSIGNEHIIDVLDMGSLPEGAPFMVLEYLDGRDLADLVESSGPLGIGRAIAIMCQVCEALEASHATGIVHRDLKPENIFRIRRSGGADFVKVLDFGISRFMDGDHRRMTGTGVMMGTPLFMAPEQMEGTLASVAPRMLVGGGSFHPGPTRR